LRRPRRQQKTVIYEALEHVFRFFKEQCEFGKYSGGTGLAGSSTTGPQKENRMKRWTWLMFVVALACAPNLWAGEPLNGGGEAEEQAEPANGWGGRGNEATYYIQSIDKVVHLTDAQKKAMGDIFAARHKAVQDFSTQNADKLKAAGQAMENAEQSGDVNAVTKAQQDYQALYAPVNQIMKKSFEDLDKILTSEQTAALQDSRQMTVINAMTAPAKLTDEQIKQLKAAMTTSSFGKDPGYVGFGARGNALSQETLDKVLTGEQKTAIGKSRALGYVKSMYAGAKLTADQQKKAEAICNDVAAERGLQTTEMFKELSAKMNDLLTADQKKALNSVPTLGTYGAPGGAGGAAGQPNPGASN
jgi:Spy/CpxP family protein refolding chaperone